MLKLKKGKVKVKEKGVVNKGGKEMMVGGEVRVAGEKGVKMEFRSYERGNK
ncbi:hypothetical protein [Neisseria sicca]|uniref:hypothetical protein n=1 Tax=Neisseria sicca TaxID=490 RepID=UPI001649B352|nr:hypothetical protein [Neisseria sicca]